MRTTRIVSLYLDPKLVDHIDAVRSNFSRSSWIEHELLKVFSVNE